MQIEEVADSTAYDEMCRLWEAFRTADVNVRYYGFMAQKRKRQSVRFQIAFTTLSLIALVLLGSKHLGATLGESAEIAAEVAAGLATILGGSLPFLGFEDDRSNYATLYTAYQVTASQMKETLSLIRRDGLTQELLGRSKQLLDAMSRFQGIDKLEFSGESEKLVEKFQKESDIAFPPDFLWNNL